MIPELRRAYNEAFTDRSYREYQGRLSERGGMEIPFRLAETPVFLPPDLRDEMVAASLEIFRQLSTPAALERSKSAVPPALDVPACDPLPTFAVTDFAITTGPDGRLSPKLIELQAFPTLYAFQVAQCEELARITPGGEGLAWGLSGLDADAYKRVVGEAIVSGLPAENVVLLDLDPPHQKTAIDFAFTEKFWDVRAIDPSEIDKRGRELWYSRDGKLVRIRRIYNRLIFDELEAKGERLPFDVTSRIDVSWAGHPNWYFRWSKHCLPQLRHPTVPEAFYLSDLSEPPSGSRELGPEAPLLLRRIRREDRRHPRGSGGGPGGPASAHAPHAEGGLRARDPDDRRAILEGRGPRHVRLEERRALSRDDARAPVAGKDDGRELQPRQDLGRVERVPLAGVGRGGGGCGSPGALPRAGDL